jgi:hypothetical protein
MSLYIYGHLIFQVFYFSSPLNDGTVMAFCQFSVGGEGFTLLNFERFEVFKAVKLFYHNTIWCPNPEYLDLNVKLYLTSLKSPFECNT